MDNWQQTASTIFELLIQSQKYLTMAATDIPMQMCKEMEPKSMSRPKQWSELVSDIYIQGSSSFSFPIHFGWGALVLWLLS